MRKYTWFALLCGAALMTACGGDDDGPTPDSNIMGIPDARPMADAAPMVDAAMAVDCDTVNQDCLTPAEPKCTLIVDGAGEIARDCVPITGTKAEFASCVRTPPSGNASVGHDDCDKGFFCSGRSFAIPAGSSQPIDRGCFKFCRMNAECSRAGDKCFTLGDLIPQDAFCVPSCTIWGTDCAPQMSMGMTYSMGCNPSATVDPADSVGVCSVVDPLKTVNSDCDVDGICADGLACISIGGGPGVCKALCDEVVNPATAMHKCADLGGGTCGGVNGFPMNIGICN